MSRYLGVAILTCLASQASAEPALGRPRSATPLAFVYPDTRDAALFYYPPGPLRLAEDAGGGPDLRFLQIIYMGSHATDDPGRFIARSVLSFRVLLTPPTADDLNRARAGLPAGTRLMPLPIRRAETRLIWTPIESGSSEATGGPGGPASPTPTPQTIGEGHLEESTSAPTGADGYWTERIFSLNPEPLSSQALWEGLQKGRVLLSLAYTFYAEGDLAGVTTLTGNRDALAGLPTPTPSPSPSAGATDSAPHLAAVRSDALAVVLDGARLADRLKRIDLNQTVPPGYAALDLRCYDFDNALRPDLALKTVEVTATGISGQPITRTASFRASAPDLSAATVRFPYAVRLDRPFRYRVTEVLKDGTRSEGVWQPGGDWSRMLDVTSPPAARPTPTPAPADPDAGPPAAPAPVTTTVIGSGDRT